MNVEASLSASRPVNFRLKALRAYLGARRKTLYPVTRGCDCGEDTGQTAHRSLFDRIAEKSSWPEGRQCDSTERRACEFSYSIKDVSARAYPPEPHADAEHDGAADHDLDDGVEELTAQEAEADKGDGQKFKDHDRVGNVQRDCEVRK